MSEASDKTADLFEALDSRDKPTIRAAVDALIPLAADSSDVRETLHQRLLDAQRKNRWPIAYVLAHLPQPSPEITQVLLDGLADREPDIRWAIGLLLVRLAKTEANVAEKLFDLCTIGTTAQKRMAIYCIRDLNLDDKNSLWVFLKLLQDDDPTVRVAAVTSLKTRSDVDANGRQLLLQLFVEDQDLRVRNAAAITLAQLGSPSEEFLSALNRADKNENPQIRKAAAAALAILQNKRSAPSGS